MKMLIVVFSIFLISCSQSGNSLNASSTQSSPDAGGAGDSEDSTQGEGDIGGALSNQVCYPGDGGGNSVCLHVTNEIDDNFVNKYIYLLPIAENNFPQRLVETQYRPPMSWIDLQTVDPGLKVSKNFKISEFMQEHKGRYAIHSPVVVKKVQNIRNQFNSRLVITSGYRSPGYNGQISAAVKWSRHMYGDAVDFFLEGHDLKDLVAACRNEGGGLALLYTQHVHCDWRSAPLEEAFFGVGPKVKLSADEMFLQLEEGIELTARQKKYFIQFVAENVPVEEDPSELIYEWQIEIPNGKIIKSKKYKPKVPLMNGVYRARVHIGGVFYKEKEFTFKFKSKNI